MSKNSKRVIAVLKSPSSISAFIVKAKAHYKAMANNPNFPNYTTKLATFTTNINALDVAQTGCKGKMPTITVESRDAALVVVKADLRTLCTDVQAAADANPAKAEAIIASTNLAIKQTGTRKNMKNTATEGIEEGTVIAIGSATGPHEWRYSKDEKTWIALPSSRTVKNTIEKLPTGENIYIQNKPILAYNQKSEWSQSVKCRVK